MDARRFSDRLKVIYVDDEPDIRIIVEMALALDPSLDVRIAPSGREALGIIANGFVPDIALLDLMMPEMSGKDVLAHLRDMPQFAKLPVLFITANARQADVDRYINEGADGVITKPFDPLSLARNVRDHFERISALRESE
ncbi:response regulator [Novosphingobium sp. JCM 18896]|uniref:response regulator n=1 Tax=Novosphingobium sp. JCM 18896 TaxID=2989731 RepID=UPI00222364A7|nr:response regulator [Novosphingobium sp. JCM 18896]MCW1427475.1 response regulator [Novosphingobium sp. JCM 18896]